MHLVLGHSADPCCRAVADGLSARGHAVRMTAMPLAPPARLALGIGPDGRADRPASALSFDGTPAEPVESVFLRASGGLDAADWSPADHAYMQSEHMATLLAWLAALDCPVINRARADSWYRPRVPLLSWARLLRRSGLAIPETVVTNDPSTAQSFRREMEAAELPGAVCSAPAGGDGWLVGARDWPGIETLQRFAPVCLAEPHASARPVCLAGTALVWAIPPADDELALSAPIRRFAAAAGLDFVELALARVRGGLAVVHVDPLPRLDHFPVPARSRIVEALVARLTGADLRSGLSEAPA